MGHFQTLFHTSLQFSTDGFLYNLNLKQSHWNVFETDGLMDRIMNINEKVTMTLGMEIIRVALQTLTLVLEWP